MKELPNIELFLLMCEAVTAVLRTMELFLLLWSYTTIMWTMELDCGVVTTTVEWIVELDCKAITSLGSVWDLLILLQLKTYC